MKKLMVIILAISMSVAANAQESKNVPSISVSGEGKMSVTPDQAIISIGAETRDKDSSKAKSQNDEIIRKMIAFLKKANISEKDYQSQRIQLYKNQNYQTKENFFVATQNLVITLKNLDDYEKIMNGLLDSGANQIGGVQFKSSKIATYETELRKKAVEDAKKKAQDYASALNQSVGKAINVSDSSQPVFTRMYAMSAEAADASSQSIAIGEIELTSTVNITFELK